jgi:hypothetical protein
MIEERATPQGVQHLGKGGVHPGSLPGCKDDGYEGVDHLVMHAVGNILPMVVLQPGRYPENSLQSPKII